MSLQNNTTDGDKEIQVKIEAYSAIQKVKDILSSLAAIALLRMQAAGGSDFSSSFWRDSSIWTGRRDESHDLQAGGGGVARIGEGGKGFRAGFR